MLIPHCNCNRHFSFLHSESVLQPSLPIVSCHYPKLPFKPFRRRASICAAAAEAESQILPQSSIQRIAEKLRSLGYVEESSEDEPDETSIPGPNSPGEIFVPLPTRLPKYRVGHTLDHSWSTPENPVPEPGAGNAVQRFHELRRRVLEEEEKERIRKRREGQKSAPSLAELTLPVEELRRLRNIGIGLKKKLKVGKAGITEGIVNGIHERWRRSELVKIRCEDICRLNMKRTHELLERKTGGLVIWRSGSNIILYRGSNYKYPYFLADKLSNDSSSEESPDVEEDQRTDIGSRVNNAAESPGLNSHISISRPTLIQGVGVPNRVRFQLPGEAQLADEADALLEGLGPRFKDWWGYDPLPVDADLLPAVVRGYKRPYRLLPYGVKPKLTNDEMNTLRRLARPLPCHFALGRNRKLQGLAASIVKLWEKCEIAKIAVKRGVQNTNSELMAEELKWLTGGTLLARDREFLVFYRGKDFLPAAVSSAIEKRRKNVMNLSKDRIGNLPILNAEDHRHGMKEYPAEAYHDRENYQKLQGRSEEKKLRFSEATMERTSSKLSMALEKKARAEKLLAQLEKEQILQPLEIDKEGITEEERYMLRKMGLRMKPFLLLGRRGVFDGTIENMHLHWKYRELVKVCIGRRSIEEVHGVARTLEAESGGILVAVEPVSKGYAIIVYRGKNYKRPTSLRPRTLLSKREAMKRSLEAQRRESLKLHVLKLSRNIEELKHKMAKHEDDTKLTGDLKPGFVEQEINENHLKDDIISPKEPDSNEPSYFGDLDSEGESYFEEPENDGQSYFGEPSNKARESYETGAISKGPEDPMDTPKGSVHIVQQNLQGDVSSQSTVQHNYLFATTEAEHQPRSFPDKSKSSLNRNQQSGIAELSHSLRSQDQTSSKEGPSVRALQLSNKERLLLRKQALKMKSPPVFAVGKSNVIAGLAKAIKAHFLRHPLAIVNIKGRAKETSAQEVTYNLEQATGAILVSQEPSKVILYRGWGSGAEPSPASRTVKTDSKYSSMGGKVKTRPPISPELISAIRLECGLKSANEKRIAAAEATADDSMDHLNIAGTK